VTPNARQTGTLFTLSEQAIFSGSSFLSSQVSFKTSRVGVTPNSPLAYNIDPNGNSGSYFAETHRWNGRLEWRETYYAPHFKLAGEHAFTLGTEFYHTRISGQMTYRPINIMRANGTLAEKITFTRASPLRYEYSEEGGFAALRVSGPDGRILIDLKSPDSKLGIRHLDLESPELRDKATVLADFPEGTYRFEGTLADGDTVRAEATLKHAFPSAPTLSTPRSGQTELPVKGAKVRWEPASDAASLEVVLKEAKGSRQMRVTLPGGATSFAIPDGFLVPGAKYEVAVGAIHEGGNRSYQEIEFTAQKR